MPEIFTTEDARRMARRRQPRMVFDFIDGAAGNELGNKRNQTAIADIILQPRSLSEVPERDISATIFGHTYAVPFGIAPMGMCNLAWPGADDIIAAEAVRRNMPATLSTAASTTLEDFRANGGEHTWYQLYVRDSHDLGMALVDRAERAGYDVLMLTVDVPLVSRRLRDLRNGFQVPFRMGIRQFLDFATHPRWSLTTLAHGRPKMRNYDMAYTAHGLKREAGKGAADWQLLDKLRKRWKGKLVVKGVASIEDAKRIRDAGADAIYVSNHGGRQLDAATPAITALAHIRSELGPEYPLLFDSGVRSGEDVIKALAVGADFVLLGRAVLYAIGAGGAEGLRALLDVFEQEITLTLAQIGLAKVSEISPEALASHPSNLPHSA